MSVLPLMPSTAPRKWDLMSPTQLPYKMDRPTYSTPAPVENIPSNNECRMVELRGSNVACFNLDGDEYICLPQAFEFFLKHLVGGLHTVYTKLKRLNITPVVCNVEQVRILRGIGAIQPGVNRCKLITKSDFEILYQDCTTASRPGRPPKRYPLLPLSADMMTQQSNSRSNNSLRNQVDMASLQKRIRLSHSSDQSNDDKANGSPLNDVEKNFSSAFPLLSTDLHSNPTANLAYLQALRQQYQHVTALSGLQAGLDVSSSQQINPAIAQILMMSNPALFPTAALPPTSIAMLNQFNQRIAQNQQALSPNMTSLNLQATENKERLNSYSSYNAEQNSDVIHSPNQNRESENEDLNSSKTKNQVLQLFNGNRTNENCSPSKNIYGSMKTEDNGVNQPQPREPALKSSNGIKLHSDNISETERDFTTTSDSSDTLAVPSIQALLNEIQGLLKLAASSASVQERRSSVEIEKLKAKLDHEKKLREVAQQKLDDCEKEKAETEKRLCFEKEERKRLHSQLFSMHHVLGHSNECTNQDNDVKMMSSSPSSPLSLEKEHSDSDNSSSPNTIPSSITSSFDMISRTESSSTRPSPSPITPTMSPSNFNTNNNASPDQLQSPELSKRIMLAGQQRLFFNNPLLFQSTATQ